MWTDRCTARSTALLYAEVFAEHQVSNLNVKKIKEKLLHSVFYPVLRTTCDRGLTMHIDVP